MVQQIKRPLAHWLQHDDALAGEFGATLNLDQVFSPLKPAPAPEGAVFYAPLSSNVRDIVNDIDGAFSRNSPALFWNGFSWIAAEVDVPRYGTPFAQRELLIEPERTNLFLNSDNPVTQQVSLMPGANVLSCFGSGDVVSSNGTGTATGHGTATDGSPVYLDVTSSGTFNFTVSGSPDFVQVERGRTSSSPIITGGIGVQRAADIIDWAPSSLFWNQPENTVLLKARPLFPFGLFSLDSLVTLNEAESRGMYFQNVTGTIQIRSNDGTGNVTRTILDWDAGDLMRCSMMSGVTSGNRTVGYQRAQDIWRWSAPGSYGGSYPDTGQMSLGYSVAQPYQFSAFTLYDEEKTTEWIEQNFPNG